MLENCSEADKTVFVGNLGSSVKEEILFELFLQAGPLKKVTIARDKEGRQRSYGFVCYKHREAVPYAIALLNGTWLYGRPIRLQYRSGSSYGDGGDGPPGVDDSPCDALPRTQSAIAGLPESAVFQFTGLPESAVFQFTGLPDGSLSQDQLCWNPEVSGQPSQQYQLAPPHRQSHYYSTQTPFVSPLPWPALGYPHWTPPTLGPLPPPVSSSQPPLSPPPSVTRRVESEWQVGWTDGSEESKQRKHRKTRRRRGAEKHRHRV